jgi:hypothetical protein
MGKMDPCVNCGGELKPTLAPLWGWRCPDCRMLYIAKPVEELDKIETKALFEEYWDALDFWRERAEKAEDRIRELQSDSKKPEPAEELDFHDLAISVGKLCGAHERARATLVKIKESYEARSELFTSDADCAANLAAWAIKALGP